MHISDSSSPVISVVEHCNPRHQIECAVRLTEVAPPFFVSEQRKLIESMLGQGSVDR